MKQKRTVVPAIVVEGKYDKIRVDSVVDGVIVVTEGFRIYHRPDQLDLMRHYAKTTGLVILTDADAAGFQIRGFLKGAIPEGKLYHVYIPGIHGKERRKRQPSAEGLLGVEGMDNAQLLAALERAGIFDLEAKAALPHDITPATLYELGLTGHPNANARRQELLAAMQLPTHLSVSGLCEVLCTLTSAAKLPDYLEQVLAQAGGNTPCR